MRRLGEREDHAASRPRSAGYVTAQQLLGRGLSAACHRAPARDRLADASPAERATSSAARRCEPLASPRPRRSSSTAVTPRARATRSAAALWALAEAPDDVTVTLVAHHAASRPGIRRPSHADPSPARPARSRDGLPVTAPARAVIDFAAAATAAELEQAMAQARVQRLIRTRELEAALHARPHRKGTAARQGASHGRTRPGLHPLARWSAASSRWFAAPSSRRRRVNTKLHGFEVDFFWPRAATRRRDRRRPVPRPAAARLKPTAAAIRSCVAAGYRVMRDHLAPAARRTPRGGRPPRRRRCARQAALKRSGRRPPAAILPSAMHYWDAVFAFLVAMGVAFVLTPLAARLARRVNAVVDPDERGAWPSSQRRCSAGWPSWPACWSAVASGMPGEIQPARGPRTPRRLRPDGHTLGDHRRRGADRARRRDRRRGRAAPAVEAARPDRRGV